MASASASSAEDSDDSGEAGRNPVAEATEILPDSEAVDPTIAEPDAGGDAPSTDQHTGGRDDADDKPLESIVSGAPVPAQDGEAQEILPDSEAVDPTLAKPDDAPSAESTPETPATADAGWQIRWQNAFIVERVDDQSYQFLFGGRVQNDWGSYIPDSDLKNSIGGEGSGVEFRRARLYFQGQFFHYGFFKAEYELAGGDDATDGTDFADVYVGLSLPRLGLLRVGRFKEPISLQFQSSSNFLSFNERASIQAFSPGRNTGIMLNRNFLSRDSTFYVSFLRRTDGQGDGFTSRQDYHVTSRFTFLPYFEEGGERLVHVELGYSHQFADKSEATRFAQGAASNFSPLLVDTGDLALSNVDLLNVGIAFVEDSLSFQSEAMVAIAYGGISEDPIFWGIYGEVSYWLTGESRRYLRARGVFSRVTPQHPFDPRAGEWGALEIAGRYSWLDLSNDNIRGGTLDQMTLALNWVLFSNFRMSNNYVFSVARDRVGTESGLAHSWVTRFQFDF